MSNCYFLLQTEFNYSSPYWTNKKTYAVEDGLEGLTEKQTKLASYWNTPFDKICLGMKVNNFTKWIVINHNASSLFDVIADGVFKKTTAGKNKRLSLMDGSLLQGCCNREGFNVFGTFPFYYHWVTLKLRIGIIANSLPLDCYTCDSCIGFGISAIGCTFENIRVRNKTCGNMAICSYFNNKKSAAFGYILVQ